MITTIMTRCWRTIALSTILILTALPCVASAADGIVMIGDSHSVLTFGQTLDVLLRSNPATAVDLYASCGSRPAGWYTHWVTRCQYFQHEQGKASFKEPVFTTPYIEELLTKNHPKVVIVAHGSNQVHDLREKLDKNIASEIRKMIRSIHAAHASCIWVGPPIMRRFADVLDRYYGILAPVANEENCVMIDSRPLVDCPHEGCAGGDGVHLDTMGKKGKEIARKWADGVFTAIKKTLDDGMAPGLVTPPTP